MTSLPPELQYGHVVGRVILAVADSGDADAYPDAVPAQGTVTFTPKGPEARVGEPDPVVVLKKKIICTIDSDGYLTDPDGKRGVWLATGVYNVSYTFNAACLPAHDIVVGAEHTQESPLDLTLALPPGGPVLTPSQYAELTARIDALASEEAGVLSVNGATGDVVLDADDVGALPSSYTPPAQSWTQITEKPATFPPTIGTTAETAAAGDDPRLSDARTPTAHTHTAGDIDSGTFAPARLGTGAASASAVLYGDGAWKAAPTAPVSSVNGSTGAVVLDADDVGALPSSYTPPAQSWTQITGKPTTFPPTIGTTATTAKAGDYVPAWSEITSKPATFAPTAHAASHATGGSDPIEPADIGAATAAQGTKADSAVQPADVDDVIRESDARLTNQRPPTAHRLSHAASGADPITPGDIGAVSYDEFVAQTSGEIEFGGQVTPFGTGSEIPLGMAVGEAYTTALSMSLTVGQSEARWGDYKRGDGPPNGSVSGGYLDEYIDLQATNGAVRWRQMTPGGSNTGWKVIEGDTGWRDITQEIKDHAPGVTIVGHVAVRRVNSTVMWSFVDLSTSAALPAWPIPSGFDAPTMLGRLADGSDTDTLIIEQTSLLTSGAVSARNFTHTYFGSDIWPSALPGTPA